MKCPHCLVMNLSVPLFDPTMAPGHMTMPPCLACGRPLEPYTLDAADPPAATELAAKQKPLAVIDLTAEQKPPTVTGLTAKQIAQLGFVRWRLSAECAAQTDVERRPIRRFPRHVYRSGEGDGAP